MSFRAYFKRILYNFVKFILYYFGHSYMQKSERLIVHFPSRERLFSFYIIYKH